MRYWWVNQNQTYKSEVPGGFLWSPKTRADGARNQFYENMREVAVGDVIFSFCDTYIKAIGMAVSVAESSPKPNFGNAGGNWSNEGWLVSVEFKVLNAPIRPKDHIGVVAPHLPAKYSPLQSNGDGLQSVYLAEVPRPMADVLAELIGPEYGSVLAELQGEVVEADVVGDEQETSIKGRTDIGATTKDQLVKSRRGQGIFKANVRLNENGCRVTGVTDPMHLRASHIKPWKDSDDEEKLNGCNGLLLAPHVDHLFDKGLISFTDDGALLLSPALDSAVLVMWGISPILNVGKFSPEQSVFLNYHRQAVFRRG
jgi:putative restriction endonuclease